MAPFNREARFHLTLEYPGSSERTGALFSWNAITPDYFRAMSIPASPGATFSPAGRGNHVVVVNREFLRRWLCNLLPLGTAFFREREGDAPYRIFAAAGLLRW